MADDLKNYPNPLDNYRSYSYHYILTVSSTTEAMKKQVGQQERPLYSTLNSVKLGGEIDLGNGDKAWLILDTRRFSQYSITDFEVEHMYGTGDPANPSMPTSSSWIKVIDTTGFTFFNFLQDVMRNKLKSSYLSCFFLLNILFVGHRDDDTTDVISTCYMPLMLMTMGAEVDFRGSICTMQFMENEGGFSRDSPVWQLGSLGSQVTVVTDPGKNTLADMFNALEDKLNQNSMDYFRQYMTVDKDGPQQDSKNKHVGKLVQYMFNLPPEWSGANYKLSAAAVSKRVEQQFLAVKASIKEENKKLNEQLAAKASTTDAATIKAAQAEVNKTTQDALAAVDEKIKKAQEQITFAENGSSQMSFSEKTTIADALRNILQACDQILEMGSAQNLDRGTAVTFKIAMNITSDEGTYIIHYDVYPYRHLLPKLRTTKTERMADDSNFIYYDYIFTGKNSHIEDLKISFAPESVFALDTNPELGKTRLQKISSAGQRHAAVDAASGKTEPTGGKRVLRASDPVIPTSGSTAQQSNFQNQDTEQHDPKIASNMQTLLQEYTQTLAFTHMLQSLNLDITIRGNPNLLRKFADRNVRFGVAPHGMPERFNPNELVALHRDGFITTVSSNLSSAKQRYRNEYYLPRVQAARNNPDGGTLGDDPLIDNSKDVLTYPIFAQINIRTPDVDWSDQMEDGQRYIDDPMRFYSGPWRVLFVKHSLVGGEFKQQLNLLPAQDLMTEDELRDALKNSKAKTV